MKKLFNKRLKPGDVIKALAVIGLALTSSFIFINLILLVPLVLLLSAFVEGAAAGTTQIFHNLPIFFKVWFWTIILFIISALILAVIKLKSMRRKR